MKYRRSGRLVHMTNYFLTHPHQQFPLSFFSEQFDCAKSSISEDIAIIKSVFEDKHIGKIVTSAGASGGATYIPTVDVQATEKLLDELCERLEDPERILPGGYLYMMDIIGDSHLMMKLGKILASHFRDAKVDAIVTMATKGIPIAYAVANFLNVPVSIVRHEQRITEGSIVSINYVSGTQRRIQTMSLAKRSLKTGSHVLIIDDFMKAGGTVRGMIDLVKEFQCTIAGVGILTEAVHEKEKLVDNYISLTKLTEIDEKEKTIKVERGNVFSYI